MKLNKKDKEVLDLFFQGKKEKAIKLIEKEIKESPKNVRNYEILGNIYLTLGKITKAIPPLIWATKLAPKRVTANFLLGVAYAKNLQFKEGLKYLKRAYKLKPNDDEIIRNLGWVSCLSGKVSEGRRLLRKALKINPKNSLIYNDLAASYIFTSDFNLDEAEKWFKKALEIEPKNPFIRQTYQSFLSFKKLFSSLKKQEKKQINKKIQEKKQKGEEIERIFVIKKERDIELFQKIVQFGNARKIFMDKIFFLLDKGSLSAVLLQEEIEKIAHYSRLSEAKLYQVAEYLSKNKILQKEGDEYRKKITFPISETFKFLKKCQKLLKEIAGIEREWAIEGLLFSTQIEELRKFFLERFPEINSLENTLKEKKKENV